MVLPPDLQDFDEQEIKDVLNHTRHSVDIAVYGSENYFNFGAIVRLSHCFLAQSLYMVDMPQYYKKATMCTKKYEKINKISLDDFLYLTSDRNLVVFERRPDLTTEDIRTFQYPDNPMLFFGSEKHGCPQDVLDQATNIVSIPMFGLTNDINISIACGIVLYDYINKLYS